MSKYFQPEFVFTVLAILLIAYLGIYTWLYVHPVISVILVVLFASVLYGLVTSGEDNDE